MGTVCVQLIEADTLQRPLCLDCWFLLDSPPHGPGAPWQHTLNGFSIDEGANASSACGEQLEERVNAPLHSHTFEHCLYTVRSRNQQSSLDVLIMYSAFILLTIEIVYDSKEQDFASRMRADRFAALRQLRRECFRSFRGTVAPLPSYAAGGVAAPTAQVLAADWALCSRRVCWYLWTSLGCGLLWLTDILFRRAVCALMPVAMIALLVVYGAAAVAIILNGLAVSFILQLDNMVPVAFLSARELESIKSYYTERSKELLAEESTRRAASGLLSSGAQLDGVLKSSRFEMLACTLTAFVSLTFGWASVTSPAQHVPCEMVVFYLYYRVGVLCGVWLPLALTEALELGLAACRAISSLSCRRFAGISSKDHQQAALRAVAAWAYGIGFRFTEHLVCVLVMNAMFWLCSNTFWQADLAYAWEHYFWGFVNDVFGLCAASGYAGVYGWDCLPL